MENKAISFCHGGGCTAKLGPAVLERVLSRIPKPPRDPNLLVGYDSKDDAAVYRLSDDCAIVQTLDFFPPMVDDPHTFGMIAAANALSDIYAMGGTPVTALNIVCFPQDWDLNLLGQVLLGGAEKVREAGASLCGGHSINDADVKYGLSVTGIIRPDRVTANIGARPGDVLILTKPLGVGIVCTARRVGGAKAASMEEAVRSMTTLNKYAAAVLRNYDVHACTDVTGFGFLGHLCEMLAGSPEQRSACGRDHALSARIEAGRLPCICGVPQYVEDFYLTAAAQRNRNHVGARVKFARAEFWQEELLFDPQTSGGLLAALPEAEASHCLSDLEKLGLPCAAVGRVTEPGEPTVVVE